MAISHEERELFGRMVEKFKDNPKETVVLLKVLFNFLQKTVPYKVKISEEIYSLLEKKEFPPFLFDELKKYWNVFITVAQTKNEFKSYTTGQLAQYFGVSITTINKWISMGRFVGVRRTEKHKQVRIPENTIWISPEGEQFFVRDIIEDFYSNQNFQTLKMSDEEYRIERIKEIVKTIAFFEDRYGGTYQEVVKKKGDPYKTDDWQWGREGKEWHSFLKEIGDL